MYNQYEVPFIGIAPTRKNVEDAGWDLKAAKSVIVWPFFKRKIPTKTRLQIPVGCVGVVKSRSGLSGNKDLEVGAGVIDPGYTGTIHTILRNFGWLPRRIKKGERISQILFIELFTPKFRHVAKLDESDRGDKGFGSSGEM